MNYKKYTKFLGVKTVFVGLLLCMFAFSGNSQSNSKRTEITVDPTSRTIAPTVITSVNDFSQTSPVKQTIDSQTDARSMEQKVAELNETLLPQGSKAVIIEISGKQYIKLEKISDAKFLYSSDGN